MLVICGSYHEEQPDRLIIQCLEIEYIRLAYPYGYYQIGDRRESDMRNCDTLTNRSTHEIFPPEDFLGKFLPVFNLGCGGDIFNKRKQCIPFG